MIEINSWVTVGKVLPRPQREGTQFKRAHSNEWKQKPLWIASNPAAFMILLEDNSQGAISARFFPVSTSHHVPTSLRRRRLVERRGLRVKEWRLVERRRRLRSWTRSWRRVNLLAMNEDCDALMQFAHFCPESLSACNANKVSCPVAL